MAFQILDGTGGGYSAAVSSGNQLVVRSSGYSEENYETTKGDAFVLHGECHIAVASTGGLLYFKNTSEEYDVYITRIYIDSGVTSDSFIIRQIFDPTRSGGTDIGTTGKVNKNRGSGRLLEGDLYISDGSSDMTFTGGTNYHAFPLASVSSTMRDMRGSSILTPNTAVGWSWTPTDGGNGVDAEIISMSVNVYRVPIK